MAGNFPEPLSIVRFAGRRGLAALAAVAAGAAVAAHAQTVLLPTAPGVRAAGPAPAGAPVSAAGAAPVAGGEPRLPAPPGDAGTALRPTWETQSDARMFILGIPAPRGQITDRQGRSLAQTRVGQNLSLVFPTPADWPPARVLEFARSWLKAAAALLGRPVEVADATVLKHYENRRQLPLAVALDLLPEQIARVRSANLPQLRLDPVYLRFYPSGGLAGHLVGYTGRAGKELLTPIQNNDLLWPDLEGREGLEQAFEAQLAGKPGQLNLTFDATGKKASERIVVPPQPGHNVVTALDEDIQRLCERVLDKRARRGAIVVLDPQTGDILAMASWPTFNPNAFVPLINESAFAALRDDPDLPLLPRAFRSCYPAGSTFKVVVGIAALESGAITPDDEFGCPPAYEVGNLVFRNWKKEWAGMLTFQAALTQSCNTWFYQVGIKTGGSNLTRWAFKLGFGERTGIPLAGEVPGRIPTDDYMLKTYRRRLLDGDLANMAIGQGDILISPLQMAQAMAAIGTGGTLYQPRLVLQVQTLDSQIVAAYGVRAKGFLDLRRQTDQVLRAAMTDVVSSGAGTAGQASVPGIEVAGKTGTAQWGPKAKERTAAWFAGFAPAANPRYAFAALYEGEPNDADVHGGSHAAPLIGDVLKELFKGEVEARKQKKRDRKAEEADDEDKKEEERQRQIQSQQAEDF